MEVELAIVSAHFAPAFRLGYDAAQGPFELIEEVVAETGLVLFNQSAADSNS
jgi:hypothetical protein